MNKLDITISQLISTLVVIGLLIRYASFATGLHHITLGQQLWVMIGGSVGIIFIGLGVEKLIQNSLDRTGSE